LDNLSFLTDIQSIELRHKGATLSLACRAMEYGHLLHSALTCSLGGNMHGISDGDTHLHPPHNKSSVHLTMNATEVVLWAADHRWHAEWMEDTARLHTFIPDIAPTILEWPCQEQCGSRLTASVSVSDGFTPAYTNEVWLLLQLVMRCRSTNHQPCCPSMFTPLTIPQTDGFE